MLSFCEVGELIQIDLLMYENFQSITDQLSVSFKYTDKESGVDHIKVQIYEVAGGTRTQKYPGLFSILEKLGSFW